MTEAPLFTDPVLNEIATEIKAWETEYELTRPRTVMLGDIPKCRTCKHSCQYFYNYCYNCIIKYNIPCSRQRQH